MSRSNCKKCYNQEAQIEKLKKKVEEQQLTIAKLIKLAKNAITAKEHAEEQLKSMPKKTKTSKTKAVLIEEILHKYEEQLLLKDENEKKNDNNEKNDNDEETLKKDLKAAEDADKGLFLLLSVFSIGKRASLLSAVKIDAFVKEYCKEYYIYKNDKQLQKKESRQREKLRSFISFYKVCTFFKTWQNLDVFLKISYAPSNISKVIRADKAEKEISIILKKRDKYGEETETARTISPLERALAKLVEEETKKDEA